MMKLQLIQPTTGEYVSNSRSGCYPPLGLVSMATFVRKICPWVKVEILDGELLTESEIIRRIDGDVVGINANTITYAQAIEIARNAKKTGATVVLGGVYPSAIPNSIVKNRDQIIDCVVAGYGEKPIVDILLGKFRKTVSNREPFFDGIGWPDRSLIDFEAYLKQFGVSHPSWPQRGTNIFSSVGCLWRETTGGCIFCSRSGTYAVTRPPEQIWGEIRELVQQYNVEYVVDFSDTILQNKQWLELLVQSKPNDLNPIWHVFGRIDEIDEESLKLLDRLGCRHVFAGIESGDAGTYSSIRKGGGSPEESLKKAKMMRDFGFGLTPSYVLGLPGETEESLNRTWQHACRLKEISHFEELFCCALIPFPGSPAFSMLHRKIAPDNDFFDAQELQSLWAKEFCFVGLGELNEYVARVLSLGKYRVTISKQLSDVRHSQDPS